MLNRREQRNLWSGNFLRVESLLMTYCNMYLLVLGDRGGVAQWLRCCATNWKVAGSIPASVTVFFMYIKSFRSTQPLTEMSTRSISWG